MPVSSPLAQSYRKWRKLRPELTSAYALSHAREEIKMRDVLARFGSWSFADTGYGSFAYANYESWSWGEVADSGEDENGNNWPMTVRVMVGDDDHGVEWGDTDPSDSERENASAYYVAIVVEDHDGTELYHDGIGGVDVIDLPGYLQRDWKDAAAYALLEHLELDRALRIATTEAGERAYWAARDVVTI